MSFPFDNALGYIWETRLLETYKERQCEKYALIYLDAMSELDWKYARCARQKRYPIHDTMDEHM